MQQTLSGGLQELRRLPEVAALIAAFCARDLDSALRPFADDAVYHNIPMEPVQGIAAIRAALEPFMAGATEVDWQLLHIATNADGAVLTERVDRFLMQGKWISVPVMGTFEVTDGRIRAWRDYFDLAQFTAQMGGAG